MKTFLDFKHINETYGLIIAVISLLVVYLKTNIVLPLSLFAIWILNLIIVLIIKYNLQIKKGDKLTKVNEELITSNDKLTKENTELNTKNDKLTSNRDGLKQQIDTNNDELKVYQKELDKTNLEKDNLFLDMVSVTETLIDLSGDNSKFIYKQILALQEKSSTSNTGNIEKLLSAVSPIINTKMKIIEAEEQRNERKPIENNQDN